MRIKPLVTVFFFSIVFAVSPAWAGSCLTSACHQALAGLKYPHQPVKDEECLACHLQRATVHPIPKGKSFELSAKGAKLCEQCHEVLGKKRVVHPPVKDGDCLSCHNPHGAKGRFLLDNGEDLTTLCLGCHDSAPFKQKFMHGPTAVGACTQCHNPHESGEKWLLKEESRANCLKCHADLAKALKESPVIHSPLKNSHCTSCHNPHGSAVPHVLRKKLPDLCLDCHGGIGKKLTAKTPHKTLQQPGGCIECHQAHYSKAKGLLPSDEKSLCLGCHGSDKLGSPPLRNIKKELDGKKQLHGPIQAGRCSACHDPHGSDYASMLRGAYPTGFYAPYQEGAYDFCLGCHNKEMLRFAETSIYTKFRNGKRNLHFVHIADKRKGRTCLTCHEPHAADGEKLISKEGPPFGAWLIPINFKTTPTGGGCVPGCHRSLKYDRDKPVVYGQEGK